MSVLSLYETMSSLSAQMAEAAVGGLEAELRRRLGSLSSRALVSGDLGVVHIGPVGSSADEPSIVVVGKPRAASGHSMRQTESGADRYSSKPKLPTSSLETR